MIIIALDYYGNAYWEIYDVTEYVHKLAGKQASETKTIGEPKIWTQNIYGKVEPEGIISHYYVLDGSPYIPWVELGRGELQRCFMLNIIPGGHTVRIRGLDIEIESQAVAGGIFILRCYGLWNYGVFTVFVDGVERWMVVFGYTIGLYGLIILVIFAPVMILILYRRISRKRREWE